MCDVLQCGMCVGFPAKKEKKCSLKISHFFAIRSFAKKLENISGFFAKFSIDLFLEKSDFFRNKKCKNFAKNVIISRKKTITEEKLLIMI